MSFTLLCKRAHFDVHVAACEYVRRGHDSNEMAFYTHQINIYVQIVYCAYIFATVAHREHIACHAMPCHINGCVLHARNYLTATFARLSTVPSHIGAFIPSMLRCIYMYGHTDHALHTNTHAHNPHETYKTLQDACHTLYIHVASLLSMDTSM